MQWTRDLSPPPPPGHQRLHPWMLSSSAPPSVAGDDPVYALRVGLGHHGGIGGHVVPHPLVRLVLGILQQIVINKFYGNTVKEIKKEITIFRLFSKPNTFARSRDLLPV
jgi:hypothetical protein